MAASTNRSGSSMSRDAEVNPPHLAVRGTPIPDMWLEVVLEPDFSRAFLT
jgi:hypothetical protein